MTGCKNNIKGVDIVGKRGDTNSDENIGIHKNVHFDF